MFCPKCGKKLSEGESCSCRTATEEAAKQPAGTAAQSVQREVITSLTDNTDTYVVISYVFILWLIPLLAGESDRHMRVRFHIRQGMARSLFGLAMVLYGLIFLFGMLMLEGTVFRIIGWVLFGMFMVAEVGSMVYGMLVAASGRDNELPVIGKYANKREGGSENEGM